MVLKLPDVPDEVKLSLIAPYVRGSVLRKLQKLMNDDEDATCIQFTNILRNDYKVVDHQDRLKIQLREIKQTLWFKEGA